MFFSFRLDASIYEDFFDRLKLRAKSFNSFRSNPLWLDPHDCQNLHHCGHFVLHHHSAHPEEVVVRKTGTVILADCGTDLIVDSILGYFIFLLFFLLNPDGFTEEK